MIIECFPRCEITCAYVVSLVISETNSRLLEARSDDLTGVEGRRRMFPKV